MNLIRSYFPEIEIYSVDEAFVRIDDREDYTRMALMIRQAILKTNRHFRFGRHCPSKTLCKLAGEIAKNKQSEKICALDTPDKAMPCLRQLDIKDIWGIGRNLNKKLNFIGILQLPIC